MASRELVKRYIISSSEYSQRYREESHKQKAKDISELMKGMQVSGREIIEVAIFELDFGNFGDFELVAFFDDETYFNSLTPRCFLETPNDSLVESTYKHMCHWRDVRKHLHKLPEWME